MSHCTVSPWNYQESNCISCLILQNSTHVTSILGVKKSCACDVVHRVSAVLCEISPDFIMMPTKEEMQQSADHFYSRFGIPKLALAVDGTHFKLCQRPLQSGKCLTNWKTTFYICPYYTSFFYYTSFLFLDGNILRNRWRWDRNMLLECLFARHNMQIINLHKVIVSQSTYRMPSWSGCPVVLQPEANIYYKWPGELNWS